MYLVLSKKFSDTNWKLLCWIVYICLVAISLWFTWGVFEKFAKQETAIQQYEYKIEAHPTIAICNFVQSKEYHKYFNITYTTYQSNGLYVEDEVILKIGKNYLENSTESVDLTIIYTFYHGMCYAINTTRNVNERVTKIKIVTHPNTLSKKDVYFTSEKNFYGVTTRHYASS